MQCMRSRSMLLADVYTVPEETTPEPEEQEMSPTPEHIAPPPAADVTYMGPPAPSQPQERVAPTNTYQYSHWYHEPKHPQQFPSAGPPIRANERANQAYPALVQVHQCVG